MSIEPESKHCACGITRREALARAGGGLGLLALGSLLQSELPESQAAGAEGATADSLLRPRRPHFAPQAKAVIWLFMEGGPSHIDLFDPKPKLTEMNGQPMPESFGRPITAMGTASNTLMASQRTFQRHGQSGLWVSDWYPHVARQVKLDTVMSNSFGFGGTNGTLVFRRI